MPSSTKKKAPAAARPARNVAAAEPKLVSLVCASNVAWDPFRRVNLHAIFSAVPTENLPFVFPQPFYVLAYLEGLDAGEHRATLFGSSSQVLLDSPEVTVEAVRGVTLVVFTIANCEARRFGALGLGVRVDGKRVEPAFAFEVLKQKVD